MNRNEQMQQLIDAYRSVEVPERTSGMLSEVIQKAQKDAAKRRGRSRIRNWSGSVAAAAVVLLLLPNLHAQVAQTLGELPVAGAFFRAVTFRNYPAQTETVVQAEGENVDAALPYVIAEGAGEQPTISRRQMPEEEVSEEELLEEELPEECYSADVEPTTAAVEDGDRQEKLNVKEMFREYCRRRQKELRQESQED